jgi:hypothetical protein
VGAADVAARCAELLDGEPLGRAPEFGGPQVLTLREMIELWPDASARCRYRSSAASFTASARG